jgi:2,4-diaminopentanoate dehydrogenase
MESSLTVAIYGAGQVGRTVASLLINDSGYSVYGPFDRSQRAAALDSGADVVVIATTSFLADVAPDIRAAVVAGSNVITTAEEAAYPWQYDEEIAHELHTRAMENQVTILGAGFNPGFAFDAMAITASGVVPHVTSLRVERVVDLSGFSATILRRLGIGYSAADFEVGIDSGSITGHIGFPQSMRIVARQMGVSISEIQRSISPIAAQRQYDLPALSILPGDSAGFRQRYVAIAEGRAWFDALFIGHVGPAASGLPTRDEIIVHSESGDVHLAIEPGINPQVGSSSLIANSIRRLAAAPAGWLPVADLPPACPRGGHSDAASPLSAARGHR